MKFSEIFVLILEIVIALIGIYLGLTIKGDIGVGIGIVTSIYIIFTAKLSIHFHNEDKFFEKFELLRSLKETKSDSEILATFKKYHNIQNPILQRIRDSYWDEFAKNIQVMHDNKSSEEMDASSYLSLIDQAVMNAKSGDKIIAVSFYLKGEFENSRYEHNFHCRQLEAISRGVNIERIFVCTPSRMEDLRKTEYWKGHYGDIETYFVDKSEMHNNPINIHYGFLCFESAIFLDDIDSQSILSGAVSVNKKEIIKAKTNYNSLKRLSTKIEEVFEI